MVDLVRADWYDFALIFASLLFAAFFAAAETAITALGSLKAKHLADTQGKPAAYLELWLNHPGRVLTTVLIFHTFFNLLTAVAVADLTARYVNGSVVPVATAFVTVLVLVFAEIVPRSFAKAHSEGLAIVCLRIVQVVYWISFPLVWGLSEFANLIIRFLGSEQKEAPPITEEELEFLVSVGERAGVLGDIKKEMLSGVFEFDETRVREIMTPRTDIVAIPASGSFETALEATLESGHSRIPVYNNGIDDVIGILFAKDLLRHAVKRSNGEHVRLTTITREPFFTPESKPIMELFKDLKRSKNHMAIVIDEYGGTAGLVTMEDILEEIVGDIQDEFDIEEAEMVEVEPGIYDVAGSMNIDEFLEFFGVDKTTGEDQQEGVDTVAGWMTQLLGDMPEVGQTVTVGPLNIEVTGVERHRIQRLRVARILAQGEEATP